MTASSDPAARDLADRFHQAGYANVMPGLAGSVIIYADSEDAELFLAAIRDQLNDQAAAEVPANDMRNFLLPDIATMIEYVAARKGALSHDEREVLDRLQAYCGWPDGASVLAITGWLSVALAQAVARGGPRQSAPMKVVEAISLILANLNARNMNDLPLESRRDLTLGRRNLCAAIGVQRNDEPLELIEARLREVLGA